MKLNRQIYVSRNTKKIEYLSLLDGRSPLTNDIHTNYS